MPICRFANDRVGTGAQGPKPKPKSQERAEIENQDDIFDVVYNFQSNLIQSENSLTHQHIATHIYTYLHNARKYLETRTLV